MKKKNSFLFSSSSKISIKKKHKQKSKPQRHNSVFELSHIDSTKNNEDDIRVIKSFSDDEVQFDSDGSDKDSAKYFVNFKQLNFGQNVDLDKIKGRSVSPTEELAEEKEQEESEQEESEQELGSVDSSEKNEQNDLINATSRNNTATLELSLDGQVMHLSKSWQTFVGTDVRKIVGKPISKIIVGDESDKTVFQRATSVMEAENVSYRVKFVVARNELRQDDFKTALEPEVSQKLPTLKVSPEIDARSSSSGSLTSQESETSEISTNDQFMELEGQGILIRDVRTSEPTHSMWILRPFVEYGNETMVDFPEQMNQILGFGVELFTKYLEKISASKITNESLVPPPSPVLCNICEQRVPNWWLERHSELCYLENKAENDLQVIHDNLLDHKELINHIATGKIGDYKGLKLPVTTDPKPVTMRKVSSALRFPFRTLHSLAELCDEALELDPDEFEGGLTEAEKQINEVVEWKIPKSNDRTINILIEDTEFLAKQKAQSVLRVLNFRKLHYQLKQEVDALVLESVHRVVTQNAQMWTENKDINSNTIYGYMESPVMMERPDSRSSELLENPESQINEGMRELSLFDTSRNNSFVSLKRVKNDSQSHIQHTSPRRPYSPGPLMNSPLTSIQRNNRSQSSNIFLTNNNDSGFFSRPNTANSSPLLTGNDMYPSIVSDENGKNPPLSPLLVSTFQNKNNVPNIKDYEIIKPISKGAFGSVYLAKKKISGEYYAIKCLRKADMIAKNQVTNVKAERAIMMTQSNSPYVAKLYYTFQSKRYLFLVMEYLNGGDCAALLKMLGTIPESWCKRYIAEIIVGVDDLHSKGIIHRDLKPDNFLIDSRGHLKLTDFGLSRMGLVDRQLRHQKGDKPEKAEKSEKTLHPSAMPGNIDFHKRSVSYASSISSSDSSGVFLQSTGSGQLQPQQSQTSSQSQTLSSQSPTIAWFDNLLKQERTLPIPASPKSADITMSPLVKPLARSNSQTSFAVDEELSLASNPSHAAPLQLYNPQSSADMRKFVGTPDYLAPETIRGQGQDESSDWWSLGCIMFEFLFGFPPFHSPTVSQVLENILVGKILWPELSEEEMTEFCSPEAKDLIIRLLTTDTERRLGHNGAQEIKDHEFFKNINWDTLWDEEATFIPNVDNPESTDYFDPRGVEGADIDEWIEQSVAEMPSPYVERRKSLRLNTDAAGEFGSFQYRNLTALEKANKDAISRLKSEHILEASKTGSTSSADSGSLPMRSRGRSITSSYGSPNKPYFGLIKHDRLGSSVSSSAYSSGPEDGGNSGTGSRSAKNLLLTRNFADSPFSSDTEESRNGALLRVQRKRNKRGAKYKMDVLLMEPIPIIRFSEKQILEKLGCNVVAVGDGDELIRRVSGEVRFDIIFTTMKVQKLQLPDIIKLIRQTNTVNSTTPIVALTAFQKDAIASKMFDDVLEKPVSKDSMEKLLQKYYKSSSEADDHEVLRQ